MDQGACLGADDVDTQDSSVVACASTFTSPAVCALALARALVANGKRPALYGTEAALSASSVYPTDATSGAV